MKIQVVSSLREPRISGSLIITRSASIYGFTVQAHPLSHVVHNAHCTPVDLTAPVRTDIKQHVAALGYCVNEKFNDHLGRLPVQVVPVISPAVVKRLARLPHDRLPAIISLGASLILLRCADTAS